MSLKDWINSIGLDKKDHLILGVIYSCFIPLGGLFGFYGALTGFVIGVYLVLWKEIYNDLYKKKGTAEVLDFVFNVAPIVIVFLTYLMR
tara:strand:- start:12666 stop:12932 length:267 start_codon:yes stop_codon:yes gene_type:complete